MKVNVEQRRDRCIGTIFRSGIIIPTVLCASLFANLANAQTLVLEPNEWSLASVPANAASLSVGELFSDELLPADYDQTWKVFTFNVDIGDYEDPGVNGTLTQGQGFWIITIGDGTVQISLDGKDVQDASVLSTQACVNIERGCSHTILQTSERPLSWNMVGSPFQDSVPASQLRIVTGQVDTVCASGCSLAEAAENGLITNELFGYPGPGFPYENVAAGGSVQPWAGYWLGVLPDALAQSSIMLLIPRPDSDVMPPGELPPQPVETGNSTIAGVDSDSDGLRDDVQIALDAVGYEASEMLAARQSLVSLQNAMLVGGGASDESTQAAGNRLARAMECLLDTFGEQAIDELSLHEFMVINTDERRSAAQAFDGQSVGRQFSSVTNGEACE